MTRRVWFTLFLPLFAQDAYRRLPVAVDQNRLRWPTQVAFPGDLVTVMDLKNNRILYCPHGQDWRVSPITLRGGHSLARLPNGHYLINDTENGRMLEAASLARGEVTVRTELAGFALRRPHDQLVAPETGDAYVIDGNLRLFRFRELNGPAEAWTFTGDQLGYARALSWFDGALHVISSSRGQVVRIDDYGRRLCTTWTAGGKRRDAPAGSFATTGLVLNDVEKFAGRYYATNYFTRSYAEGADPNVARLICFETWKDFEAGRWEDLSARIPGGLVPYFLTAHGNRLYCAAFNHESPGDDDGIYVVV